MTVSPSTLTSALRHVVALAVILMVLVSAPCLLGFQTRQLASAPRRLRAARPESVGMSSTHLSEIDQAVRASIARKETPGAVALVARKGAIVYHKAFGNRVLEPRQELMTLDTIFDLASLTKTVATATSIMILVERGKLSLADPVALYIPEFGQFGKERISVEQLLTHRAGLPPDNEIADYVGVSLDPLKLIYELRPSYDPGTRFVYSDVGYIVAAEIIRRVSGKPLDQFAHENIFAPLGMNDTMFLPIGRDADHHSRTAAFLNRIAPTESREGRSMRGEVHDPRSYELGGVAGHAGLFSTAADLAVFCQMILNRGEYNGVRIMSQYTVARMLGVHSLPHSEMRGIGWDVNTSYSSNRGDLFPVGSFGHTGFTGTSFWIDPGSATFVILLTNRVHPDGKGDVTRLRSFIASIVAGAMTAPPYGVAATEEPKPREIPRAPISRSAPPGLLHPVLTGIDVLERDGFKQLDGKRVGLITNQTGRDSSGRSTIDVLAAAPNVKLVALFAPEHGLRGIDDTEVGNTRDEKTGLPVYSLYDRNRRRPSADMLRDVDALVFDIQDVGTRFYTYIATCGYAMEEAARQKIKFIVLDRPNPINGYDIEGPVSEPELTAQPAFSFTSYHAIPVRYGMTLGELALLLNTERKINADLTVIRVEGWRRADYYDGTALAWVNPSPNMRSLTEAHLYPGIGLLETTNLSVGRGTDTPFEIVGAPWIDGRNLAESLNRAGLPGVRFVPIRFTPRASKFSGEECGGINIIITDRGGFRPVATGIEIAYQLNQMYPNEWKVDDFNRLLVNRTTLAALKDGKTPREIAGLWQSGLAEFAALRKKYLLY